MKATKRMTVHDYAEISLQCAKCGRSLGSIAVGINVRKVKWGAAGYARLGVPDWALSLCIDCYREFQEAGGDDESEGQDSPPYLGQQT